MRWREHATALNVGGADAAHMTAIGVAPRRSALAEGIRDLQRKTRHDRRGLGWRLAPTSNLGLLPSLGLLRWFGSALRLRLLPRFELLLSRCQDRPAWANRLVGVRIGKNAR